MVHQVGPSVVLKARHCWARTHRCRVRPSHRGRHARATRLPFARIAREAPSWSVRWRRRPAAGALSAATATTADFKLIRGWSGGRAAGIRTTTRRGEVEGVRWEW